MMEAESDVRVSRTMALHLLEGLARVHYHASKDGGAPLRAFYDMIDKLEDIAGVGTYESMMKWIEKENG
jgi:hypothetical protein